MEPQVTDVATTSTRLFFLDRNDLLETSETRTATCAEKEVGEEEEEWQTFSRDCTHALYSNLCAICGGPDPSYHYGALSCLKCKALFRKIIKTRPKELKCKKSGNCPTNQRRKRTEGCVSCRFQRCLKAGMRVDCVLKTLTQPVEKKKQSWDEYLPSLTAHNFPSPVAPDSALHSTHIPTPNLHETPLARLYGSGASSPSDLEIAEICFGTHDYFVPQYDNNSVAPAGSDGPSSPAEVDPGGSSSGGCVESSLSSKLQCFCPSCAA